MSTMAQSGMSRDVWSDIDSVNRIASVPSILEVVCRTTGMRFAAVARVTEERWVACSVRDEIDFGLKPGGELKLETTICHEIRQSCEPVIIDHVAEDERWRSHPTPAMYGFQSYISLPIVLANGTFFGTLCAIDPRPNHLRTPETIGMFRLFAELIAKHLDLSLKIETAETALLEESRMLEKSRATLVEYARSNEALQRFAAIASHDLREPLRQVSIFTEILANRHQDRDEETHAAFAYVTEGTGRMARLIDGLLAYCQIDAQTSTPLQSADMNAALRDALAGLKLLLHESGAVVTSDRLPNVQGNQAQLAQVLQNLLNNAVKYRSEEVPQIHVSAARNGDDWIVAVRDNGIGIAREHRVKIFEAFARLHGPEISGVGLGLAFCTKIIELHRGRIWAESNPAAQAGSVFYFSLPAV